jgi:hypothetical protein
VKDLVLLSLCVLSFASLVTIHCTIVFGLAMRRPRSRAALAFVVAPLAPYFALREGMTFRAGSWIVAAVVYALGRALSRS